MVIYKTYNQIKFVNINFLNNIDNFQSRMYNYNGNENKRKDTFVLKNVVKESYIYGREYARQAL